MKITTANYKKDKLYPAVVRAMTEILKEGTVLAPLEVLLRMQRITKKQVEDWRFRRIPYLERVTIGGLGKMNRILWILELHARALKLEPTPTVYRKWGKGRKRIVLRFSKSGHPNMEAAYSRHYLTTQQKQEKLQKKNKKDASRSKESTESSKGKGASISPTKASTDKIDRAVRLRRRKKGVGHAMA